MTRLVTQTKLMGIPYVEEIPSDLSKFSLIVDGIFGFSFRPPIREPFGLILKKLAQSNIPIFSIDIPSGIASATNTMVKFLPKNLKKKTYCLPQWRIQEREGGRN